MEIIIGKCYLCGVDEEVVKMTEDESDDPIRLCESCMNDFMLAVSESDEENKEYRYEDRDRKFSTDTASRSRD